MPAKLHGRTLPLASSCALLTALALAFSGCASRKNGPSSLEVPATEPGRTDMQAMKETVQEQPDRKDAGTAPSQNPEKQITHGAEPVPGPPLPQGAAVTPEDKKDAAVEKAEAETVPMAEAKPEEKKDAAAPEMAEKPEDKKDTAAAEMPASPTPEASSQPSSGSPETAPAPGSDEIKVAEAPPEGAPEPREEKKKKAKELDPCDRTEARETPVVDATKIMLEERVCSMVLWVDGLFGGQPDVDAARRAHGFLETGVQWSQFDGVKTRTRLRAQYDLPNAKNRLSAFVGRDNDEEFIRGRSQSFALRSQFPGVETDNQWLAGLGYQFPDSRRLQTGVRAGVRGITHPRAFAQGQLRWNAYADQNNVLYTSSVPFLTTRDGLGITQSFDFSHVLGQRQLIRWNTVGTVSQRTDGLNWRNSLIDYYDLRNKRGVAFEAFITGETDEPEPIFEYGGRVILRHPVLKQKLFLEWVAGYSWPRDDPAMKREGSVNFGMDVQLPFGSERLSGF